jgi:ketosteroid isomerase-like protein
MLMVPTFGETGVGKEEEAPVWEAQEKNKALVRRYLEEQAKGNIAIIDELVAPDFVDRSLMPGQEPDREGYKRSIAELTAPFSDINITIEHQVAEGDMVMTWYWNYLGLVDR